MLRTKQLGNAGEQAVASYLEEKGFTVHQCNFATRRGEVDVIAGKDDLLVFVEVKTRQNEYFPLSQLITRSKQKRIRGDQKT